MRVRNDKPRFSVAALLLCLFAAFAISPPDYFRAGTSSRSRASRTVRLDDHDLDHSLDIASISADLAGMPLHDQPFGYAILPSRAVLSGSGGPPGIVPAARESRSFEFPRLFRFSRPPPAA